MDGEPMEAGPDSDSPENVNASAILIGGQWIQPGARLRFEIPVAKLPTGTHISLPIEVIHGTVQVPTVWISAAVHGDELNGVEIARLVLEKLKPNKLLGTLIVVPMVNGFGVINQ